MSPKSSDKTPEPSLLQVVPTWTKSSPHPPRMDVPYQEAGHESSDSESPMSSPMSSPLPPRLENPAMRTGVRFTRWPSARAPETNPPKDGPGSFFKKMLSKGDAKRQEDDGGEDGSGPEGRTSQGTKAILTGGPWPTSDRHR
ncbi:hypothetical protein SODALDRAFT_349563 [Sodiomyces alkalinus F11]|uniref:Uncharacterized protein n=1 Tax=Sodiomyces alkalinus (strain CBS 110278 / VKM F-3762 / F11) TaxID=1314773 RepID=A0A3N2Q4N3_SODAK|nr:hypothetical protein SODALDRAFT_349563 [Sodiomyces alkalinus F11]ROT41618.1 hypothetical protein SODALDRAFT_349563 [Sodiomyces alkalinus F11]